MLAIRDRNFEVSSATLDASLSLDEDVGWRFQWSLEVETVGQVFDGATWHPRRYAEAILLSLPSPDALQGHVVHVPEALNADGAPNFLLYVFEHESAYDVKIAFGPWHGEYIESTLVG